MTVDSFDHAGLHVRIVADDDPLDPCAEFDQTGTMVCWHSRYYLGHTGGQRRSDGEHGRKEYRGLWREPCDFEKWWKENGKGGIRLPLALLDHSGLHMWVGSGAHPLDPGGWDSGQVGWIFITRDQILREFGGSYVKEDGKQKWVVHAKRMTSKMREKAEACLCAEVKLYDRYLTGDVYGYIIEDDDGNRIDSCWGFYGDKDAVSQAKEMAEHAAQNLVIGGTI